MSSLQYCHFFYIDGKCKLGQNRSFIHGNQESKGSGCPNGKNCPIGHDLKQQSLNESVVSESASTCTSYSRNSYSCTSVKKSSGGRKQQQRVQYIERDQYLDSNANKKEFPDFGDLKLKVGLKNKLRLANKNVHGIPEFKLLC